MPEAARKGEPTSHPGSISGPGAPTVLINGVAAVRVTDNHACAFPPPPGPHPGTRIASGSGTVLILGQPAARKGDTTDCGASILTGSPNVRIGG